MSLKNRKEETFISHLEALRTLLIKCLSALGIGFIPMFLVSPYAMDRLIGVMMADTDVSLNFFSPMEVFLLELKVALVLDILICFPYVAKKVWHFILPALYENERQFIKSIVLVSSGLFIFGVCFCLFVILPWVINFGLSFISDGIQAMWGINQVMSLALWLAMVFGLMFQFPLVTYALIRWHIVAVEKMKKCRPYVFVGILILSAILTPPDVVSQILLTLPTYALFEIGLVFGKKAYKSIE